MLWVEEKRDPREYGNLLDDGVDVCVLESEEPRGDGPGWASGGHEEKAQEDTRQQRRAPKGEIQLRSHELCLLHVPLK